MYRILLFTVCNASMVFAFVSLPNGIHRNQYHFSPCIQSSAHREQKSTSLLARYGNEEDDEEFKIGKIINDLDVDAARTKLENLLTNDDAIEDKHPEHLPLTTELLHEQPPPTLTDEQRKHLAKEIELLSGLYQSDNEEALTNLWTHWFAERGPGPASQLLHAEQLANVEFDIDGKPTLIYQREAEELFRDLIEEHGIYWAEPVNRLATLLYRQGRYRESKACCQLVLAVKPWHFGALSGMVMVCTEMRDVMNARIWADRRLPPVQPTIVKGEGNERRKNWIRRAVRDATNILFRPSSLIPEEDVKPEHGILKDDLDNTFQ